MITDCGSNLLHLNAQQERMSMYTGDKDKRRRSNSDKYMWTVITTCNIIFAIYLLQYKAPATLCTSSTNPIVIAKNTTQLPFYLARSQSFGFFYDISNDHWRLYKDIYNSHIDHRYPNHPMTYNPEGTSTNSDPIMWSRRNNWPSGYYSYAGKSALVLFYDKNSCVQYKVSTTWLFYLTLVCLY